MSRPPSDRSYARVPPSTSSTSLNTAALLSSPLTSRTAAEPARPGLFSFSSLAGVWTGLKQAAGAEVGGFWRAVGGGVGGTAEGERRVGDKRESMRDGREEGRADGERRKRRRTEQIPQGGELLFDGVPPLMPPISHASPLPPATTYSSSSSSPAASRRSAHSSSPETSRSIRRRDLRPYTDSGYEDTLMRSVGEGEDILPPLTSSSSFPAVGGGRNSTDLHSYDDGSSSGLRSLSGRRKLSVSDAPSGPVASTSALAGRPYAHPAPREQAHSRTQSYAGPPGAGVQLPSARHVHFAPMPGSASLPNLASLSSSSGKSPDKSPKTPRRSTNSTVAGPSPSSSLLRSAPQVASMLLGEEPFAREVSAVWARAKEEERARKEAEMRERERMERETRERRERRIRELESEVERLKGELAKPAPPPSLPKSPRVSFPPPPPPPPPPPVGKPHPLLLSVRRSLKATPPRPLASSSKLKRRASTLGGEGAGVEMGAFLEELGGGRGRLRKVGLPEERRREKEKGKGGELGEVLQRAFARKFANTASPSTPRLASSRSTLDIRKPEWTSPRPSRSPGLSSSRSHPADLSSLAGGISPEVPPVPPLPPQPVFTATATAHPPPRTTSLAVPSTETTVFGEALSTDLPAVSAPAPVAGMSPSTSLDSLAGMTSAPPDPEPDSPEQQQEQEQAAGERLSRARRRSGDGSPLPGLDLGRTRPTTPARGKARRTPSSSSGGKKRSAAQETESEEEDEVVVLVTPPYAPHSTATPAKTKRGPPTRSAQKKQRRSPRKEEQDFGALGEADVLTGYGANAADPSKVFGRA
ncbi:hypothetical protein JCM10213_004718 [Rhodosporidiobolus nylandii]